MDKNQVLAFIKQKLADGTVTSADVASLAPAAAAASPLGSQAPAGDRHSLVAKVLYALGALIVIIGAGILVADNWNTLGSGGRILVSLGLSLIAYVFGLVSAARGNRAVASVAYVVSVASAPFCFSLSF